MIGLSGEGLEAGVIGRGARAERGGLGCVLSARPKVSLLAGCVKLKLTESRVYYEQTVY